MPNNLIVKREIQNHNKLLQNFSLIKSNKNLDQIFRLARLAKWVGILAQFNPVGSKKRKITRLVITDHLAKLNDR